MGRTNRAAARHDASRYLLDDRREEDEEEDGPNKYQEVDFLVNGTQDSEEELYPPRMSTRRMTRTTACPLCATRKGTSSSATATTATTRVGAVTRSTTSTASVAACRSRVLQHTTYT